jgi:putative ABC transport system permease protein
MALGASAAAVRGLVVGQALRLVSAGVVVGLIAAVTLTRFMDRLLFEVEPFDPWTLTSTALILLAVAGLAAYLPARRGTRLSPVDALRTD